MNLVSGNIRFGDICGDSPGRGRQMRVGLSTTANFGCVAASSETSETKPAILHGDMLPLVCL